MNSLKNQCIHNTAEIVDLNVLEKEFVSADTDVTKVENKVVKGLFDRL